MSAKKSIEARFVSKLESFSSLIINAVQYVPAPDRARVVDNLAYPSALVALVWLHGPPQACWILLAMALRDGLLRPKKNGKTKAARRKRARSIKFGDQ